MRAPLLILISLLVTSAAAAEALRLPPAERPQAGTTTAPLKGAAGKARAGSCASYGPRFVMVEGTGTCVKIGGSISIDTTVRR
ncbi:hypothetical protein ML401_16945 [Bradyrhizobium sp. 62B]|jgi:hypothetical protein|uniref:hypothetical protein n=1 Tax=unclassified Bradyrhizobium TaxID=2631580 RepID=UPI001BA94BA8|nr:MULTISPECIES: hypothetical protein [Bradyrhizobium]MBR0927575.1 hypothetical protein [Bradyrhizobium diazoefficiens]MDT4741100.1 hypothetical protein [Bradyrhizobium sp. WYCCWR 12699]WIW49697.1 hypothetical protein ML401_16945 [Bradyrhizobium sp. 62B]